MISEATFFTQSLLYFCLLLFFIFGICAFVSLVKPSLFIHCKLPSQRFYQFIIFLILSLAFFGIAHIFIPEGFP